MAIEVPDLYPSEPLSVRLMNTVWADRAGVHDSLRTVEELRQWARMVGLAGPSTLRSADLGAFRRVRDALRRISADVTGDTRQAALQESLPLDEAVRDLNAAALARTPVLSRGPDRFHLAWQADAADPGQGGLAAIALDAAELYAEHDQRLRACYGPGCVLYFVKDHSRRGWCSAGCGNRARVARHYRRHRPS